jgi:hypothetical protein
MYSSYSNSYTHSEQMVRANQDVKGSHNKGLYTGCRGGYSKDPAARIWVKHYRSTVVQETPLHMCVERGGF